MWLSCKVGMGPLGADGENCLDALSGLLTGGGLVDNTARVIPVGLSTRYGRATWALPAEMKFLSTIAEVPQTDNERTWNCDIGILAIVEPAVGDLVIRSLAARSMQAWIAGFVEPASDSDAPRSYLTSADKG
jgi:phosphoribosylformylglycinamidine cyclo-ligase